MKGSVEIGPLTGLVDAIVDLTAGFTLDRYAWADGAHLTSLWSAADDNGLSHFTEHMLFRGTERYPDSLALNTAVEKGRANKLVQRAIDREIDAWETSCRLMFVVTITASHRSLR